MEGGGTNLRSSREFGPRDDAPSADAVSGEQWRPITSRYLVVLNKKYLIRNTNKEFQSNNVGVLNIQVVWGGW